MLDGTTQLVAIVGSPIVQVKSPLNFNTWFQDHGLDLAMLPIDLRADSLPAFIGLLRGWQNLRGCVVTVPYKQLLAGQLDQLSARAQLLGSVNVIRREADGTLCGDNVDGEGFLGAARQHGFVPAGGNALVLGAGGVGSAIGCALCEAGLARLVITDVDAARARALGDSLRGTFPATEILHEYASLADFALVANASPVGMGNGGELPLSEAMLATLTQGCLVADVVTSPAVTAFLHRARALGARTQTGAQMARAQMGHLGHFMGVMPPGV
ncbi:shikimate dehydrogenase [Pseudomonas sp. HR96]|uniref:shikimate dehydrogenase family protein n=1 Tax=Pseudomonas sp. HR96 TaxID=1027966 RepID=UPI002A75BB82|nr:shikimate dehydrogenase [Pseudomonas sp. HR96]WPO98277.1 shikimate dehydrogenase [Pseudomonas sp. HR96]